LTAQNGMIGRIKRNLERCGYSNRLLRMDYVYADNMGSHTVPLAGFASPVHDFRTSCISVIKCQDLVEVRAEQVNEYRGLGAPVVFVCCNGTMQLWTISREGAVWEDTFANDQLDNLFAKRKEDFKPDRLWRAKNLGRVDKNQQLGFVDIGLMPLLEDEMGEHLGGLMKLVIGSLQEGFTEGQLQKSESQRWIFRAAFWLLCAKILQDKQVKNFVQLDLADIDVVLEAVTTHYGAQDKVEVKTGRQRSALEVAADRINTFASLSNLTTEAFGYMYEHVLVDKKLRSALGIHATPSYLVDYIVWQLWPWIEQIPENKRVVLEPACGHAPFLTGAMRLLRELFTGDEKAFHKYAKRHLIGIETDSFAREIERLSLTMADIPNPNGWKIVEGDIYQSDVLSKQAKNATILLCNPPFENFTLDQQNGYRAEGHQLRCFNKAAEMLWRTLPFMPEESVFGVILPRVFLHKKNLAELRKTILRDFELSQICTLPENVFTFAGHISVILLGRKRIARRKSSIDNGILYRRVPKEGLKRFKEKYQGRDQHVLLSKLGTSPTFDLRIRELDDIWDYCEENLAKFNSVCGGGQGLSYIGKNVLEGTMTFDKRRFTGAVRGYALFNNDIVLHGLPEEFWMNLAKEVIDRPRWGLRIGRPQILMNYARVGSGPWRIKALIDREGRPVTSAFLTFQIQDENWSLFSLWAILNSPLANAYVYCNSMERHNLSGTVRAIPIPSCTKRTLGKLDGLVAEYFTLMEKGDSPFGVDIRDTTRELLLSIDAEVTRLYDLPPKMEKRVLDLFQGVQRKGVDFSFTGYYPEDFESAVPLHEYLSEEYQRSTVSFVERWVEDNRSPEIIKAFERASEAFDKE
jgi:hypothetical protein